VAILVKEQRPDLLLLQEATRELEALPSLVGGHFHRVPLPDRIHGLAVWSPHPFSQPQIVPLPESRMPGRVPLRVAQLVRMGDITFANVHLSHGQLLNRRQLARIVRRLEGPAAVIGDYNAFGPTILHGFRDVGPRQATHIQQNLLRFRLDRCLVRGLSCVSARTLKKGKSDHRPISLQLATSSGIPNASRAKRKRRGSPTVTP
jgi:endonuclease/exonuclease/phosphatase family metal-dependent hydrolase